MRINNTVSVYIFLKLKALDKGSKRYNKSASRIMLALMYLKIEMVPSKPILFESRVFDVRRDSVSLFAADVMPGSRFIDVYDPQRWAMQKRYGALKFARHLRKM